MIYGNIIDCSFGFVYLLKSIQMKVTYINYMGAFIKYVRGKRMGAGVSTNVEEGVVWDRF